MLGIAAAVLAVALWLIAMTMGADTLGLLTHEWVTRLLHTGLALSMVAFTGLLLATARVVYEELRLK